jgi:hypothetical protein
MKASTVGRGEVRPASTPGQFAPLASNVMDTIHGQLDAQRVIHDLRTGAAGPDRLLEAVQHVFATANQAAMRGFCRELSKALERSA